MMTHPARGQLAQVWYAEHYRAMMPLHGRIVEVVVPSRGKPRNHGVVPVDRPRPHGYRPGDHWSAGHAVIAVPAGNLRRVWSEPVYLLDDSGQPSGKLAGTAVATGSRRAGFIGHVVRFGAAPHSVLGVYATPQEALGWAVARIRMDYDRAPTLASAQGLPQPRPLTAWHLHCRAERQRRAAEAAEAPAA